MSDTPRQSTSANTSFGFGAQYSSEVGVREDAHAVVIGINRYLDDRIPDLSYARADAESVYSVLTDPKVGHFKKDNVALLVDHEATERRIKSEIATKIAHRADPNDIVCVFYAGHGAPSIDPRGRSADGMEKYLVPHDASADDLRATAISMNAIHDWFEWIQAKRVVFFIDACYSGTAADFPNARGRRRTFDVPGPQTRAAVLSDDYLEKLTAGEGRFVVTACRPNEVSIETADLGHGLFTHHLLSGLKGAADPDGTGLVTLDRLYSYVYDNVSRDARKLGGAMNPLSKGTLQGAIYLTQYETDNRRRARAANASAKAALAERDLDRAEELWREALTLEANNAEAQEGLTAIGRLRDAQREEEESRKKADLHKRRVSLLRRKHNANELTVHEFAEAIYLVQREDSELSDLERKLRSFVLALADGEMSPAQYVPAIRVLKKHSDSGGTAMQSLATPPDLTPNRPAPPQPQPPLRARRKPPAAKAAPELVRAEPPITARMSLPSGRQVLKFLALTLALAWAVIVIFVLTSTDRSQELRTSLRRWVAERMSQ